MAALQATIGLELHVQLTTRSKLFSAAATHPDAPNRNAAYVDQGLPGTLPVLNQEAVRLAVRLGLALGARVCRHSEFARKNYFYPDLPKGYQISQYDRPILQGGTLCIRDVRGETLQVELERAHLEEDAGKSVHHEKYSGIDLNRAGTPLLEIVTEPCLHHAADAAACMRKVHALVRYLEVSTANMERGELRCDANISVAAPGATRLGTRTEIKNLNSFRFVERAIEYELRRHTEILEGGGTVARETRLYDSGQQQTRPMRSKETEADYRYFPDPDLPPLILSAEYIAAIRAAMPELPDARCSRYLQQYGLTLEEAETLVADRPLAEYFEAAAAVGDARTCAHWITGELTALLKRHATTLDECRIAPGKLGALVALIEREVISSTVARQVLETMWDSGADAETIIAREGLTQLSDVQELERLVAQVLQECPKQVEQYRQGKTQVLAFLMGRIMQRSRGQANPARTSALLKRQLSA